VIVVVAGSRRAGIYALVPAFAAVRRVLDRQAMPITVRLRAGLDTGPGVFETAFARAGIPFSQFFYVEWRRPGRGGRQAVWIRDADMILGADLVLCFYTQEDVDRGDDGGTLGLVDKAVGLDVPVYGYLTASETATRTGEHDPEDVWGSTLPAILP
jgi:hypothetical protein